MPKRGKNGRFINRQTVKKKGDSIERPDDPKMAPPLSPPPRGAMMRTWPTPLFGPKNRKCEDCGQELEEQLVIIRRHVIYISACPRCCEDPVGVIRGD